MNLTVSYRRDNPYLTVTTLDELDAALDDMRQWSLDPGYGVIATIEQEGDRSRGLDIGVKGDRGYVSYGSHTPRVTVMSVGENVAGEIDYRYQGAHSSEIPARSEIPFEEVRKAVHEFAETGQRPTNISWESVDH